MKQNITIKVNTTTLEKMKDFYKDFLVDNNGEYVAFQAYVNDVQVTGYTSKKDKCSITFSGEEALKEARIWDENAEVKEAKKAVKEEWIYLDDQIGSDEVGVGDFLLPMVVVAAFVSKNDMKTLKELGIHDSKKLTDEKILEIGPKALTLFKGHFHKNTIPNWKYNEQVELGENLNSMKAKMHNKVLLNTHNDYPDVINIFVDQFCNEDTYYRYLKNGKDEIVKGICFKTKGESHFPSVALASVIARYSFLKEVEKLNEQYHMNFPFGAGSKVNEFAKEFIKKYGIEEFDKIAKKNFANYNEVIQEKLI